MSMSAGLTKANRQSVVSYNDVEIGMSGDMLNLTAMWRASGENQHRAPAQWARKEGADFIRKNGLNVADRHIWESRRGKNGGVWAHWQIGMAYAAYLSPQLHAHINEVYRAYLQGDLTPPKSAKEIARENGKPIRSSYTRCLSEHGVRGRGFARCTDAINVQVLGAPSKRLKEKMGLKKSAPLRDSLGSVQLMSLGLAEALAEEQITEERCWGNEECEDASAMAARTVSRAVEQNRASRRVIEGRA